MKQVIDNFSTGSSDYALYRPESPASVFDFIYSHNQRFETAWDCGTGNGQVANRLADKFAHVYGTDISNAQLQQAPRRDNISYVVERAEHTSLPDHSIDLVTIAQAIHWFDFDAFYKEVRRVVRPGGMVAAWTYATLQLTPAINEVIERLYTDITGPYWDKERAYVDAGYGTVPFPFEEIKAPLFSISRQLTLWQLTGYLRTWSGSKHYQKQTGADPISLVEADLQKAWGPEEFCEAYWPVYMRAGYVR